MNLETISNRFRTCDTTGLNIYRPAQKLMWANAMTGVLFLTIGGVMAILIALTRWSDVHLLPQDLYYRFITVHGTDMLVFWIVFFEIAILIFASSAVLKSRYPAIRFAWFNYALMLAGALLVNVMMFMGEADVMFTAYPPLKAHPLFYWGIIMFAFGTLFNVIQFFFALVIAKREGWHEGTLPLFTYGVACGAIIAVFTIICGAIAIIATYYWSLGYLTKIDPALYRVAFWGFGHPAQQINLCVMVSIWYLLGTLIFGSKPVNEKFSRWAFVLYIVGINLGSVHHLIVDPGLSATYRIFNTSYFAYAAVIGSMIHAFSIPAAVEVAQRAKGLTRGLFDWLVKAPWSNPAWSGFALSFVFFGFVGGVTGVLLSVEQLNMLQHNTLRVPGHFHAVVVGGTTLAFMAIVYYLIPILFQRKLVMPKIAKYQPYIFVLGLVILVIGMHFAGVMGAPRRHWDVTMQSAMFQVPFSPAMYTMLALVGIGGIGAFIGLFMFIIVAVASVFFGDKIPPKLEKHMPQFA